MSLNDRAVTLLYLLQDFVQLEGTELRGSLWDYVILLGYDLITSKKLVDCAELLRIFLCTTQSPRALLDQPVQSSMRRIGIIDGMGLVRPIQNDTSPEVRSLGVELERLCSADSPFPSAAHQFVHAVLKSSMAEKWLRANAVGEFKCTEHQYQRLHCLRMLRPWGWLEETPLPIF